MSEEFVLDTAVVRGFVADVRATIAAASSPEEACAALRPRFAELLADPDWLPASYQEPAPASGMGGGIGQWLLHRGEDRSLSLFSLVVPPGSETPIHDHLAWGLVGLYRGEQDEEIYAARDGALELVERRSLVPGDFYALIPPRDDIHRVRTTSAVTSVSIHLLTNDTGCVWRHSFDPASGEASAFRSGYVNVACEDDRSTGKRLKRLVDAGKRWFGGLRALVHRLPAGRHLWRVGIAVVGLVVVVAGRCWSSPGRGGL
jgi:3-mercaptopropionate dioxygenase